MLGARPSVANSARLAQADDLRGAPRQQVAATAAVESTGNKPLKLCKRGNTPLEIFRSEWIAQQRAMGRRFSVASKEAWAEVRQAFNDLPEERVRMYEQQSVASLELAAANRRILAARDAPRPHPQPQSFGVLGCDAGGAIALASAGQGEVASTNFALVDATGADFALPARLGEDCFERDGVKQEQDDDLPVHPDILQRCFEGGAPFPDGQLSVKGAERVWADRSQVITKEIPVPKKIDYGDPCGALCRSSTPRGALALQAQCLKVLFGFVKGFLAGRALSKVSLVDLVFAAEVCSLTGGAEQVRETYFYALASGAGRVWRTGDRLNLVEMQVQGGNPNPPFAGLRLKVRRRSCCAPGDLAAPQRRLLGEGQHGAIAFVTEDEATAAWCFHGGETKLMSGRVRLTLWGVMDTKGWLG